MGFFNRKQKLSKIYLITNVMSGRKGVSSTEGKLENIIEAIYKDSKKSNRSYLLADMSHFGKGAFRVDLIVQVPIQNCEYVVEHWRNHYGTNTHGYNAIMY